MTGTDLPRVGFVGLGIMGSRMAANLARAGHELTVFNRTRANAEAGRASTAARSPTRPPTVGAASDVVITMVVDGDQVREVLLGEQGVARARAGALLCVDMSTIAPAQTRAIGAELAERGHRAAGRARHGLLAEGDGRHADDHGRRQRRGLRPREPLFEAMGELVVHVGPLGHGEIVKLINNAVAAANAATVGEALLVGRRPASTSTRSCRSWARARAARRCST